MVYKTHVVYKWPHLSEWWVEYQTGYPMSLAWHSNYLSSSLKERHPHKPCGQSSWRVNVWWCLTTKHCLWFWTTKLRLVLLWFQHDLCPSFSNISCRVLSANSALDATFTTKLFFHFCGFMPFRFNVSKLEHAFLYSYLFQKLWISFMAASNISLCFSNWHENSLPLNLLSYR